MFDEIIYMFLTNITFYFCDHTKRQLQTKTNKLEYHYINLQIHSFS